ncbi:MAG: hypothetical protein F2556_04450 [Actinobacteria bacterium]|nr:hypothetical protein [Actinomycetota bacterium]
MKGSIREVRRTQFLPVAKDVCWQTVLGLWISLAGDSPHNPKPDTTFAATIPLRQSIQKRSGGCFPWAEKPVPARKSLVAIGSLQDTLVWMDLLTDPTVV